MKLKYPKYIAIIYLSLLFIPFILLQSFYPFFRFGMFAEPVSKLKDSQTNEVFKVYYQSSDSKWQVLQAQQLGFGVGHYEYIARNYFYSQKGEDFLRKTHQVFAQQSNKPERWILVRKHFVESDSSVVAQYHSK